MNINWSYWANVNLIIFLEDSYRKHGKLNVKGESVEVTFDIFDTGTLFNHPPSGLINIRIWRV